MKNPFARFTTKQYNLPKVDIGDLPDLVNEWNQAEIDADAAAALQAAIERNATYDEVIAIIANGRQQTGT